MHLPSHILTFVLTSKLSQLLPAALRSDLRASYRELLAAHASHRDQENAGLSGLMDTLRELAEETKTKSTQLGSLQGRFEETSEQLREYRGRYAEYKQLAEGLTVDIETVSRENVQLSQSLERTTAATQTTIAERDALLACNAALEKRVGELQEAVVTGEEAQAHVLLRLKDLTGELESLESRHALLAASDRFKHDASDVKLQIALAANEEMLAELVSQRKLTVDARRQRQELEQRFEASAAAADVSAASLRQAAEHQEAEGARARALASESEDRWREAVGKLSALEEAKSRIEEATVALAAEKEALLAAHESLQQLLTAQQADASQQQASAAQHLSELKAQVELLKQSLQASLSQEAVALDDGLRLRALLAEREAEVARLSSALAEKNTEVQAVTAHRLQVDASLVEMRKDLLGLGAALAAQQSDLQQREADSTTLLEELATQQAALQQAAVVAGERQRQLEAAETLAEALAVQLEVCSSSLRSAASTVLQLRGENEDLLSELDKSAVALRDTQGEMAALLAVNSVKL